MNVEIKNMVSSKNDKYSKRPVSSWNKKHRRPKSYKKRKTFNFLDNYVTEQFKEYKKKESENHLIKMNLYKEIGMPPLPKSEKKWAELLKNNQEKPVIPIKPEEKPLPDNNEK